MVVHREMAFLVCVFGWFWVGFVFLFFMVASNWRTHAVPAGALAFVRWAAGGHGQQCVVSGFLFFILFRFSVNWPARFSSFCSQPRRRAGAGA